MAIDIGIWELALICVTVILISWARIGAKGAKRAG